MSHSSFSASAAYILLFCVATIVQGQTTTRLPPAAAYADGSFTSPNNAATQILDDGINLNITWSTSFPSVNLYLITGDDYGNSQALTSKNTSNPMILLDIDTLQWVLQICSICGRSMIMATTRYPSCFGSRMLKVASMSKQRVASFRAHFGYEMILQRLR
jgi:hypothetical protein